MKTRATNGREFWTRAIRCAGCGETVRHYEASWDAKLAPSVFAVPYANHNGGIHHEISVPEEWPDAMDERRIVECVVYLSECCDTVHATKHGDTLAEVRRA